MPRHTLVLVDANQGRLARLEHALSRYFDLYACSSPDLAISTAVMMKPSVVVAHMEQDIGTGLDLSEAIIEACDENRPMTMVWGRDSRLGTAAQVRVGVGADVVVGQDLTPEQLVRVLARRLKGGGLDRMPSHPGLSYVSARKVDAEPPVSRAASALPPLQMLSRARARLDAAQDAADASTAPAPTQPRWQRLSSLLTRPVTPLIEELPEDRHPTWKEIALARASGRNIVRALTVPVTPLVEEIPDEGPLTLEQVLRARASGRNLGLALRPDTWRRVA